LDEVGRGALAGPLVGAATILNSQVPIHNLNDSKKLNKKQREELYQRIMESGATVEVEIISARQINNRGMGWANKEIFKRLIRKIEADRYIVDGNLQVKVKGLSKRIKSVVKADQTRKCVMAASIIAKVTRDEYMGKLHDEHVMYGWDRNAGYGTKKHIEAIREYGVVRYHRNVYVTTALRTTDRFDG
jgi:ribonuclease HII